MKTLPLILVILLASCRSFLLSGTETFSEMYVIDKTGCDFKKVVVITKKLSLIGVQTISFYLETDNHKIRIPRMEFDCDTNKYTGVSDQGVKYIVTYVFEKNATTIKVRSAHEYIVVSNDNICAKKKSYY